MSQYGLISEIEQLRLMQDKLIEKLSKKESFLTQQKGSYTERYSTLTSHVQQLKDSYNIFAEDCKTKWMGICQQLLQMFNKIVQVYEIKVDRLEDQIEDKENKIVKLQSINSKLQAQCLSSSIFKEPISRRVKISDIISEGHNTQCSSLINSLCFQAITEVKREEQKQQPILLDLTEQLNRQLFQKEGQKFKQEQSWEEEVSPIFSVEGEGESLRQALSFKKYSLDGLSPNMSVMVTNVKASNLQEGWQLQRKSSSKLQRLRKSLIMRKRESGRL